MTPVQPSPRILVVEDDPSISSTLLVLLAHYGYQTSLAVNVADARRLIEQPHGLIVLDMMLPDGSGINILEKLRMSASLARVIVLTGSTDASLERRIRRLTPDFLFRKPLNFLELLDGIRQQMSKLSQAA